jgi:hypothetical protein
MRVGKFVFAQLMEFLPWEALSTSGAQVWWRSLRQALLVQRPVFVDGLGAVHLPREPARSRGMCARAFGKALSPGHSQPHFAQHARRCQRVARLAHLRGVCSNAHRQSAAAVCQRPAGAGPCQYGIRTGLDAHRALSVDVSVGALPIRTRSAEATHAGGSARQHSEFQRRYSHPVDRTTGLRSDHTVRLTGKFSHTDFPEPLRRVRIKDLSTGKSVVLLTNNFSLPALSITTLYRCRWQNRTVL